MTTLFEAALSTSLTVTALTLLLALLSPMLRKLYTAKTLYILWLIVLLGFLMPFRIPGVQPTITAPLPSVMAQAINGSTAPSAYAGSSSLSGIPRVAKTQGGLATLTIISQNGAPVSPAPVASTPSPVRMPLTWLQLSAIIWLAGFAIALLWQCYSHWRFMRTICRWQKPVSDAPTLAIFEAERQRLTLKRKAMLLLCPSVDTPMLVGLLKPRVLLPDDSLTADELALVLRHELTHAKRYDLWSKAALLTVRAIHWFNPVIYLLSRSFIFWQEASCDEAIIHNATLDQRRFYSETIIQVIRRQLKQRSVISTTFYGGGQVMKRRILSIMEGGRRRGAAICTLAASLTLLCTMAFAITPAAESSAIASSANARYVLAGNGGAPLAESAMASAATSPIGLYLNGTPVTVVERVMSTALDAWNTPSMQTEWARVLIAGDGMSTGISGWMPLIFLAESAEAAPPSGKLINADSNATVPLYVWNTTDSAVLGNYAAGTPVQVLGKLYKWYHVQVDRSAGFVQKSSLSLDPEAETAFALCAPLHYDDIPRLEYQALLNYSTLRAQKAVAYGGADVIYWSMEDKAWLEDLRTAAYGQSSTHYELPQAGDVTEAEATDIAWDHFINACKPEDALRENYHFYTGFCTTASPEGPQKQWEVIIASKAFGVDYTITLHSPSGEVNGAMSPLDYWDRLESAKGASSNAQAKKEWEGKLGPYAEWSLEDKAAFSALHGGGHITLPDAGAISQQAAVATARQALQDRFGLSSSMLDAWVVTVEYVAGVDGDSLWYMLWHDASGAPMCEARVNPFTDEVIDAMYPYNPGNG